MGVLPQSGKLQCPYDMCRKVFDKPIVMLDSSNCVRETYYACPHCRSKVEIDVEDPLHPRLLIVEDQVYVGQRAPVACQHYVGYLRELPADVDIPDRCAVCPKVIQCSVKKNP